jgi:RNA polymerase sigma-70 factor, ECF subfamily
VEALIARDVAMREAAGDVMPAPMTIDDLFSSYAVFVWRTLRQFGVASADLEDQTQEVFLIAHRRIGHWDGKHPRAWLFAIARRCASAYRRRSHRRHEEPVATVPEEADPGDPSVRAEIDLLNRVFQTLDEDKQIVFILHEVEGMSMREVAEAVQCPLKTAFTRYYAARRELTRALGEAT